MEEEYPSNQPYSYPLSAYHLPSSPLSPLLPSTNSPNPQLTSKLFTGQYAVAEAFFYQLMKLALEGRHGEVDYRERVREGLVGERLFEKGELGDGKLSDGQYRRLMGEFMSLVESQSTPNFDQTLQEYPVISHIISGVIHKIVPYPLVAAPCTTHPQHQHNIQETLMFLCGLFGVKVWRVGPCYKFQAVGMLLTAERRDQVYLTSADCKVQEDEELLTTHLNSQGERINRVQPMGNVLETIQISSRSGGRGNSTNREKNLRFPLCSRSPERQLLSKKKVNLPKLKRMKSLLWKAPTYYSVYLREGTGEEECCGEKLYKEFTDSFVLQQMSVGSPEIIRGIKGKYKERREVSPFANMANLQ